MAIDSINQKKIDALVACYESGVLTAEEIASKLDTLLIDTTDKDTITTIISQKVKINLEAEHKKKLMN